MKGTNNALTHVAGLMTQCSFSEHRVLTAVAMIVGDFDSSVSLSLTELEERTGLSRYGVRCGVTEAIKNGYLIQVKKGNSYDYQLCFSEAQSMPLKSTKYASENHTLKSTPAFEKHNSEFSKAQPNEPSPYIEFRSLEREEIPVEKTEAFQTVARIVKRDVGFLTKREFDFEAAVALWGEQLEALWQRAVAAPNRKLGEKPIWRFQDACERNLELGLVPPEKIAPPAPPPEPDENGIIIGETYWHTARQMKTRVVSYRRDWQAYSCEVPTDFGPDREPCPGRYETFFVNDLHYLEPCAA